MADDAFDRAARRWADGQRSYAKFVARYWADERFRETVRRDPATALDRAGVKLSEGLRPKLVEVEEGEIVVAIPHNTGTLQAEKSSGFLGSAATMTATTATWGSVGGTTFCLECFGTIATQPCTEGPQLPEPGSGDGDTGDAGDTGELKGPQPR